MFISLYLGNKSSSNIEVSCLQGGLTVFDLENDPTQTKEAEIISGYLKQARERSAPAGASRPKSVASPIPNRD